MCRLLRKQISRIPGSLRRGHLEREPNDEIDTPSRLLADRFISQGLTADQARYETKRQFGGMAQMKTEFRERSRFGAVEAFVQDGRAARCIF